MLYLNNHLLFTGLRGESLYMVNVSSGEAKDIKVFFRGIYGRLRSIVKGPDGNIYLLTNNRDGRGTPAASDDRILKIDPKTFNFE